MSTGRNEFKSLMLNLNDLIIGSVNIHGKSISKSQALISNIKVRFKNVRNFGVHWYLKMVKYVKEIQIQLVGNP